MSAQSGDVAAGSAGWVVGHPGFAALVAAFLAHAGLAALVVGLVLRAGAGQHEMIGALWNAALVGGGASLFVLGVPTSLGFAGASCATQRELWPGIAGGFAATLLVLVSVAVVLPLRALA